MALSSGRSLESSQILGRIGAGGGEKVCRARGSKSGCEVAFQVLAEALARDPERLARFRREAYLLASSNQPNIVSIYGREESGRLHCLLTRLLPGQTLAARLRGGPLEVQEALGLPVRWRRRWMRRRRKGSCIGA